MTRGTPMLTTCAEGLIEIDRDTFYVIPDLSDLEPFLMSLVSDADHWCFISSSGGLTAGRRDASTALFPYETDDRLHSATGISGPVTVIRVAENGGPRVWQPFGRHAEPGVHRAIAKSTLGNVVVFEEANEALGLVMRYRWATSDRFGFVRSVSLANIGASSKRVTITDGIVNVLPDGLTPAQCQSMSNLTNAYRRSELVGGSAGLALHTMEALMTDQAIPAEALRATVTWSIGPGAARVTLDGRAADASRTGEQITAQTLLTGRPGAHLVTAETILEPGASTEWHIIADVAQDHAAIAALEAYLASAADPAADVAASVRRGSRALSAKLAAADAMQHTGDDRATVHHAANVLFNIMRGGVFENGYVCETADFVRFIGERNRAVEATHVGMLANLPAELPHSELVGRAAATEDPDLERLAREYLPLSFSRRHGDPSRPWNQFSIRVKEPDGRPVLRHEGNWRDIFQNWEALCLSFPAYLPSMVTVFVNASTVDGFNPYRITRAGFEWEVPEPENPWSNIGYWGDHQIVYLLRLLESADRMVPGAIDSLLERRIFTYADVPYRLRTYDDLVADPRSSITYDVDAARRTFARSAQIGGDGKLLTDDRDGVYHVSLLEKLLVPALSKLSSYVPGGGIWMNTQRPEWNDANNALVGYGLSMVTLYHLRRYLSWLMTVVDRLDSESIAMSAEVVIWLRELIDVLRSGDAGTPSGMNDRDRATIMQALGRAFSAYRAKVYAEGFSGSVQVPVDAVKELCALALPQMDATIRVNRRADGLYHSYNLIRFDAEGRTASIEVLPEMLEGQVAALSSGVLEPAEAADVVDALYASALYRPDQNSFVLYPNRRPPPFLQKNLIPGELVASNPLFVELLAAGDSTLVSLDVAGRHHFNADLKNAGELAKALDRLSADPAWRPLVDAHRSATLDAYEAVFNHHAFTGRSGAMYAYEGLGSIYWHMVAKLLVATQECVREAQRSGAAADVVDRLRRSYYRIRSGLGFNKTAAEYGAFPTDPYSHTPAHAGAQQPGMTGQVKEEIVTRLGRARRHVRRRAVVFRSCVAAIGGVCCSNPWNGRSSGATGMRRRSNSMRAHLG